MFENLDMNLQVAIITAGSALIGAVIGVVGSLLSVWINRRWQIKGKLSLHIKFVYSKCKPYYSWGFYHIPGTIDLCMQIPLWLDVVNTSGISKVVRNINIYAFKDKKEIASFNQIQRIGNGESVIILGNNESYTLVIPANSALRFDLEFDLKENDIVSENKEFDELVISYFDENNKIHAFKLAKINKCWIEGELDKEKNWIDLKDYCDYFR